MPDLDRSIYDQLHHHAGDVRVPPGDLGAVMGRGHRRQRRHRAAVSVVAVVAVAAVTGGLVTRSGGGRSTVVRSGGEGLTPSPGPAADTQLQWSAQPVSDALGYTSTLSSGATQYALSTAPAGASTDSVGLWRSTNGLNWSAVAGPKGVGVGDVTTEGNTVYAVGTGTATAATAGVFSDGLRVASSNGGQAWQQVELPLDFAAPAGALDVNNGVVKIAANAAGVVAVVTPSAEVDLSRLLPAGVTASNWTTTSSGIQLLGAERADVCGPGESTSSQVVTGKLQAAQAAEAAKAGKTFVGSTSSATVARATTPATPATPNTGRQGDSEPVGEVSCFDTAGNVARSLTPQEAYPVTGTYTWAQLHLGPEAVDAVLAQPIAFFSSDGQHFSQVTLPAGGGVARSLSANSSGFVLASESYFSGGPTVFRSADGQHWTSDPLPGNVEDVLGAATVDGHLLAVVATNGANQVLELQGTNWMQLAVPGLVANTSPGGVAEVANVAFGPLGVALVISENTNPPMWEVLYSPDGSSWTSSNLATLSGGSVNQVVSLSVGSSQVVVTVQRPLAPNVDSKVPEVAVVGTPTGPSSAAGS